MLLNEQTAVQLGNKKVLGVRQGDKFILGRHNLVPNGQGRYTSGTIEVHRNYFRNSGLRKYIGDWGQQGPGDSVFSNVSRIEDLDSPSGFFCQGVVGSSGLPMSEGVGLYAYGADLSAGTIVRPSVYIKRSVAGKTGIRSWFVDSSGAVISNSAITDSNALFSEPNQVVRIVGSSRVAPEGSKSFCVRVVNLPGTGGSVIPEGETLSVGCVSTAYGDWFDGSYSPDPDLTPSWTGTANASASVLTGIVPVSFWPVAAQRIVYRTTLDDGTYANRFCLMTAGPAGINIGLPTYAAFVGQIYGVKLQCRSITRDLTPVFRIGSAIISRVSLPAGEWVTIDGSKAAITNEVWKCGLLVDDQTGAQIGDLIDLRLMCAAAADTEEEALRLVRAPYRDGDFPGWTWDGTPGQSASRGLS